MPIACRDSQAVRTLPVKGGSWDSRLVTLAHLVRRPMHQCPGRRKTDRYHYGRRGRVGYQLIRSRPFKRPQVGSDPSCLGPIHVTIDCSGGITLQRGYIFSPPLNVKLLQELLRVCMPALRDYAAGVGAHAVA